MLDMQEKVKLEREVDKLLASGIFDVETLAKAARDSMKRNAYDEALKHVEKARKIYKPVRTLAQALCDGGKAKSAAEARRLIELGVVTVDGLKPRGHTDMVEHDQVVTVKGQAV